MLLHLVPDDKFIDSAAELFESVAPGLSLWVIPERTDSPLRHVRAICPHRLAPEEVIQRLRSEEWRPQAIVVHWLSHASRKIVLCAPRSTKVCWLGWGGDYYHLIARPEQLLGPATLAWIRSSSASLADERTVQRTASPSSRSRQQLRRRLFIRLFGPGRFLEQRVLRRITHFVPIIPQDLALIQASHPSFRPIPMRWHYPEAARAERLFNAVPRHRGRSLLFGNSATPTNNHLDALLAVDSLLEEADEVIVPLAYGLPAYRDHIISVLHRRYGVRFRPLLEFQPFESYMAEVARCKIAVMPHRRQQGLGNILMAKLVGCEVAMADENPLTAFLRQLGFHILPLTSNGVHSAVARSGQAEVDRQRVIAEFGYARCSERTRELVGALTSASDTR